MLAMTRVNGNGNATGTSLMGGKLRVRTGERVAFILGSQRAASTICEHDSGAPGYRLESEMVGLMIIITAMMFESGECFR